MNLAAAGKSSAPTLTLPVERGGKYVFEFGDTSFEVDPALGARVTSWKLGGAELLTGPDVEADNFGSTFWPSPQSAWDWPPPAEIDKLPYDGGLRETTVTLESQTSPSLGLGVTKSFTPDLVKGGVIVEYTLENRGSQATRVAPWEITRLFPRGMCFFPTGGAPYTNHLVLPESVDVAGVTFVPYDAAKIASHQKLFADGRGGYLAHVDPSARALIVKVFEDISASQAAPGEGEIEIYFDGQRRYIELEQQGAYTELARGQSFSWKVGWYLRKIPETVSVRAGSAELVALATSVAAR
jgi:hypothetical protein